MVRLAVSTPDSPPLTGAPQATQVIAQSANNAVSVNVNNSYETIVAPSTSSPVHTASVSPSQMQQNPPQLPPQALQMPPHHMPPPFHQTANGAHLHDNGHHHNGGTLYIGAAYANEFYPGAETPHGAAFFIPPELCPAHTQLCTAVHPEYGKTEQNNQKKISSFLKNDVFLFESERHSQKKKKYCTH